MKLELSKQEEAELREIADVENRHLVTEVLNGQGRVIQDRSGIGLIRDLAGQMLETGAAEVYGFDTMEDVYERASRELYPESYE